MFESLFFCSYLMHWCIVSFFCSLTIQFPVISTIPTVLLLGGGGAMTNANNLHSTEHTSSCATTVCLFSALKIALAVPSHISTMNHRQHILAPCLPLRLHQNTGCHCLRCNVSAALWWGYEESDGGGGVSWLVFHFVPFYSSKAPCVWVRCKPRSDSYGGGFVVEHLPLRIRDVLDKHDNTSNGIRDG